VTTLLVDCGRAIASREKSCWPECSRTSAHRGRLHAEEHPGHTLQATALLNELYLRLIGGAVVEWQDRAHFLAVAAQQLRRIPGGSRSGEAGAEARRRGYGHDTDEGSARTPPLMKAFSICTGRLTNCIDGRAHGSSD